MSPKPSVCILYGINEGPAMGRQMVRCFEQAGFRTISNPKDADIIFAHSGGCFLIPPNNRAAVVMLVGLPYWPHRSWMLATALKVWREGREYQRQRKLNQWLRKWALHFRYAFLLPSAVRMGLNQKPTKPWNGTQAQIIVRNRYDEYSSPALLDIAFRGPRTFISLPGQHDDCWDSPKPYVALVRALISDAVR